ncbi:MAG: glycosyltransferase family 2 protein [Verrucomicrobiae bacterium]|nr:glycosyltransferase family 2 protein [Verrucomicrobiae bacterium]MDW7979090.1 glycosyltransferase family 2 protein [Verrucomicrobiales bacterium]
MRIVTVISNYNEQGAIEATIRDFRENATIVSDLIVIDNCSTDASLELVKKAGVNYLRHPVNTGGSAGVIKTALLYADMFGYDVYCHMDGDNQHNAAELAKLVQPIAAGEADIVIGSRFIKREGFQSLPVRRVGIFIFSRLVSALTGQKITDLTSGFRAYNKRAIHFFARKFKHEFEACVQMLMVAAYAGLRIREVPVIMNPRLTGRSEFNLVNSIKFPIFGLVSIAGTMLQRNTIKALSHADQC